MFDCRGGRAEFFFAVISAVAFSSLAYRASFDLPNYVSYATDWALALNRFQSEPLFPLFTRATSRLGISPELSIRLFIGLASFLICQAIVRLTSYRGLSCSILSMVVSSPFILFSLMVPRQGFATGLLLMVFAVKQNKLSGGSSLMFFLIAASFLAHQPTAIFGIFLVCFGSLGSRILLLLLSLILALSATVLMFRVLLFGQVPSYISLEAYSHYFSSFRETGFWRMAVFLVIALVYLASVPTGGNRIFSKWPARNWLVGVLVTLVSLLLYQFVTTDAARLVYLPAILMVSELSRRISLQVFPRGRRIGNS